MLQTDVFWVKRFPQAFNKMHGWIIRNYYRKWFNIALHETEELYPSEISVVIIVFNFQLGFQKSSSKQALKTGMEWVIVTVPSSRCWKRSHNARYNQDFIVKSGCNQTLLNNKNLSTLQIRYKWSHDCSKLKVAQFFLHALC